MSQAYQQVELVELMYVVINTHMGLFQHNRLPFGVSSAPSIFQRVMESILGVIPNAVLYINDIWVVGRSIEEHLVTLEKVLLRLKDAGLLLKKGKCVFIAPPVTYLGHRIDAKGFHPMEEKVRAVLEAPRQQNISELKSYLGSLSYYSKFLLNLSAVLAPLSQHIRHEERWHWMSRQSNLLNSPRYCYRLPEF